MRRTLTLNMALTAAVLSLFTVLPAAATEEASHMSCLELLQQLSRAMGQQSARQGTRIGVKEANRSKTSQQESQEAPASLDQNSQPER